MINFIMLMTITGLSAQVKSSVEKLFDQYAGQDGYTTVYISKYMFDMFRTASEKNQADKDEMERVLSKLDGIKILVKEADSLHPDAGINFYKELMKELPVKEYKELMVIKEHGTDVKFLVKENDDRISELLLVTGGPKENVLISITGDIDLKSISSLSKAMNIEGMENLDKINK